VRRVLRRVLEGQAIYYILTGVWPLVSLRTFERVTGPKVDDWLVQTVGVLAAVIGTALLIGARQARPSPETLVLSIGAAAGFAAVDLFFVLAGRIPLIYLADAAVEVLVLGMVLAAWESVRHGG